MLKWLTNLKKWQEPRDNAKEKEENKRSIMLKTSNAVNFDPKIFAVFGVR